MSAPIVIPTFTHANAWYADASAIVLGDGGYEVYGDSAWWRAVRRRNGYRQRKDGTWRRAKHRQRTKRLQRQGRL